MQYTFLALLLLLTACARPRETVLFVSSTPGDEGSVRVETATTQRTLTQPLTGVTMTAQRFTPVAYIAATLPQALSGVLRQLQALPRRYVLYFDHASHAIRPESEAAVQALLGDVAAHPASALQIVGHTDMTGAADLNERLSVERAEAVKDLLVARGLTAQHMAVSGRGSRELHVVTEAHVPHQLNRRVEIWVKD